MSNEEGYVYVSPLERLQSESRYAAERRCRDNDATIDQDYTYENQDSYNKTNTVSQGDATRRGTHISYQVVFSRVDLCCELVLFFLLAADETNRSEHQSCARTDTHGRFVYSSSLALAFPYRDIGPLPQSPT